MFKCQFRPCPYESKRESNCKQHMEKAHGWAYVRSKNNGKTIGKKSAHSKKSSKGQISTPGSTIFSAASPEFTHTSPYTSRSSISHSVNGSIAASEESAPFSSVDTPFMTLEDTFGPFNPNINWDEPRNGIGTADPSPYTPESIGSWDASMNHALSGPSFEGSMPPVEDNSLFTENFDWSNLNTDFTSNNMQLITPATSIETHPLDAISRNPSISYESLKEELPSLSPGGHGNVMLYSPYSQDECPVDEGFEDFVPDVGKPANDFTLFDSCRPNQGLGNSGSEHMFQELSTSPIPSAWSGRGTEFAQQLGVNDLMQVDE